MTITRSSLAQVIDNQNRVIADLQRRKRELFSAYRRQLLASGMPRVEARAEIAALKAEIDKRRKARQCVRVVASEGDAA